MHLEFLSDLAREAGRAILDIYDTQFTVTRKEDRSPLTQADMRSHEIITRELRSRYPHIPVLSEEGKEIPYSVRQKWSQFWLVDPLDGTKEFIKRNGEFTVNIALIEKHTPLLGVIYIPVPDLLYIANVTEGCWEISKGSRRRLYMSPPVGDTPIRVVKSRSHPSPNLERFLECLPSYEILHRGSALKFCAMAACQADFYPRFGPTWEWDTAAGHAIVSAAGGVVVDLTGKSLTYNKPELINGPFLAASGVEWLREMGILEAASAMDL